jgi:hypothetical protein
MKLKELQDVLHATEFPIVLFTNRLRWGECASREEAEDHIYQLADFVTIKADLKDHIFALEQILEICDIVAKGRYLEDHQRCHWKDHTCQYACTTKDEHCDSFDDRTPHAAILGWLEELNPLRDRVKEWILAQGGVQQGLREGLRRFFPIGKAYQISEDAEGHSLVKELTPAEWRAKEAARDAEEGRKHDSVANRVEQYELNLARIRVICEQEGSLQEVATLITEGMPPQLRQPVSPS